jgi:hypothetical protein
MQSRLGKSLKQRLAERQAYGCDCVGSLAARDARQRGREAARRKAGTVDKTMLVDSATGRLDSTTQKFLAGGKWGAKTAADIPREALTSQR